MWVVDLTSLWRCYNDVDGGIAHMVDGGKSMGCNPRDPDDHNVCAVGRAARDVDELELLHRRTGHTSCDICHEQAVRNQRVCLDLGSSSLPRHNALCYICD